MKFQGQKISKDIENDEDVKKIVQFEYLCRYHEKYLIITARLGSFFYFICPSKKDRDKCIFMVDTNPDETRRLRL